MTVANTDQLPLVDRLHRMPNPHIDAPDHHCGPACLDYSDSQNAARAIEQLVGSLKDASVFISAAAHGRAIALIDGLHYPDSSK